MTDNGYLYELKEISRIYTQGNIKVRAVDRVSLKIKTGEFTAFVGPSGSGKTTLFNMMGALDLADEGTIFFKGQEISGMNEQERSRLRLHDMGFVFQAYNLLPVLTARENVEYVLTLRGVEEKERIERSVEMLRLVGLEEYVDRFPAQLSGGQQQRVAVARAMVGRPSVILADEPTANLDSHTSSELLDHMEKLNREFGITFLFSTHDPRVMERAHNVVELVDGHLAGR